MKLYNIAFLILAIQLTGTAFYHMSVDGANFWENIGYNNSYPKMDNPSGNIDEFDSDIKRVFNASEVSSDEPSVWGMGQVYTAIFDAGATFFNFILSYLSFPSVFLAGLDVPQYMCRIINYLIIFIEGAGIVQFITGRSFKGME